MRSMRTFAFVVVFALVAAACSDRTTVTTMTTTTTSPPTETTTTTVALPSTTTTISLTTTSTVPKTTTVPFLNTSSWEGEPAAVGVQIDDFGFFLSVESMLVNAEFVGYYAGEFELTDEIIGELPVLRWNIGSNEDLIVDLPWVVSGAWEDRGGVVRQYRYVGCYNPFDVTAPSEAQEPALLNDLDYPNVWSLVESLVPGVRYPILLADYQEAFLSPSYPLGSDIGRQIVEYIHSTMDLIRAGEGTWVLPENDNVFFKGAFVVDVYAIPPCLHGD